MERIGGVLVVVMLVFCAGICVWSVGYQGEVYQELGGQDRLGYAVVEVGEEFTVHLPKADNPEQVWMMVRGNDRVEGIGINREGKEEVWTFQGVRVGHAPLEFAWTFLDRGLWPSDERRVIEGEVR